MLVCALLYSIFIMVSKKKVFETQVLVERDSDGVFIVSLPGVEGAHANGATLESAMKHLKEVLALLREHHGEQKFLRLHRI